LIDRQKKNMKTIKLANRGHQRSFSTAAKLVAPHINTEKAVLNKALGILSTKDFPVNNISWYLEVKY